MVWLVVILSCLWSGLLPVSSRADHLSGGEIASPGPKLPPVAGIPYADAGLIVERHREELMRLPGVQGVMLGPEGILVYTDYPTALPAEIEGLPIKPLSPVQSSLEYSASGESEEAPPPRFQQGTSPPPSDSPTQRFPPIAGIPYEEAGVIADRHREELMRLPGVYIVTVGDGGLILGVLIPSQDRTVNPEALQAVTKNLPTVVEGLPVKVKPLPVLPPPPGVIVLQPGGIREQADSCPVGFVEVPRLGWRFCVDPGKPESIPPLMEPPIAGIPYETAVAILERHREELMRLPEV